MTLVLARAASRLRLLVEDNAVCIGPGNPHITVVFGRCPPHTLPAPLHAAFRDGGIEKGTRDDFG